MGLKLSPYRITIPTDNGSEMICYSTLTTSVVVLSLEEYREVFDNLRFSNKEICSELLEMGLLYDEEHPQHEILQTLRGQVRDANSGITGVTIAPTMSCNARCYYCFEHGARWGTMSEATAIAVADFLLANREGDTLHIAWFGGEPLMAPHIIDTITSRLKDAGVKVESTLTTNGLLLTEEIRNRLASWGCYRVQITLDGIGEKYNEIKSYVGAVRDPFETVMENIEALFAIGGVNVHIRINYKSTDRQSIEETFTYIQDRFGNEEELYLYGAPLDLPEVKGYSEFDKDEGCLFLDVLHMSLDNGYENDELNFRDGVNISGDYNAVLGELMLSPFPAPCYMTNKWRYVIDDQGKLYKCQKHLGKEEFSCGDVFSGIVENDYYNHYVTDELHDSKCQECFMLPICQGGCNANRLLYSDKFACPPSKTIASELVRTYYRYLIGEERGIERTMSKFRKGVSDEGSQQGHQEAGRQGD